MTKEERKEYHHQYYLERQEEQKEYYRKYYQEHKEAVKRQRQQYYQEHKKERKEYHTKYYHEHRAEIDAKTKQWQLDHPERYKERQSRYQRNAYHKRVIKQLRQLYASENKPDKVQRAKDAKRLNNFGCTRKEIAEVLHCAETTVDNDLIILGVKRTGRGVGVSHGVPVFEFNKGDKYCYDEARDCRFNRNGKCIKCESTIFTDWYGQRVPCEHYMNGRKAI